jgi:hypothetical protein
MGQYNEMGGKEALLWCRKMVLNKSVWISENQFFWKSSTGISSRYLEPRETKWQEAGENYIMRGFTVCTLYQILLECRNQRGWDGQGM